jgi:hypothetical protein
MCSAGFFFLRTPLSLFASGASLILTLYFLSKYRAE